MNGGSNIVGLRPGNHYDGEERETPLPEPDLGPEPEQRPRASALPALVFAGLAIAWLAFVAWSVLRSPVGRAPFELMATVAYACAPLILLATLYLILVRGSRVESRRVVALGDALRLEQRRLVGNVDRVSARLNGLAHEVADANEALASIGEEAAVRLQQVRDALREDLMELRDLSNGLARATASAVADGDRLRGELPQAQQAYQALAHTLDQAGAGVEQRAQQLDRVITLLANHGQETDAVLVEAARGLGEELQRLQRESEAAGDRLGTAGRLVRDTTVEALTQVNAARQAMLADSELQQRALGELVTTARSGLQELGGDATRALNSHVRELDEAFRALGALLDDQRQTSLELLGSVRGELAELDGRFDALDGKAGAQATALRNALAALGRETEALTPMLAHRLGELNELEARADAVRRGIAAGAEEVLHGLPEAGSRVAALAPELARVGDEAARTRQLLSESEALLERQAAQLDGLAHKSDALLSNSESAAQRLATLLGEADASARALAHSAGSELIEALLRVREAADAAAQHARDAIGSVIPEASSQLSGQLRDHLQGALTAGVEQQLRELVGASDQAVAHAVEAARRIEREVAGLEAAARRLDETKHDLAARDEDNFARRVALLMEALNSTAIDVGKILSTEVTDTAWQAYLRGDRGVFTRRAVRLLDANEVRQIASVYEQDASFRESVNRYIHDFETMLRHVLSTREASTLSVTLLSSDIGKLYVALAQAVERLRV